MTEWKKPELGYVDKNDVEAEMDALRILSYVVSATLNS
jgi:hypothetical protein